MSEANRTSRKKKSARPAAKPGAKAGRGKKKAKAKARPVLTAATADRHVLYEAAVQNPDAELDFVTRTFKRLRGRSLLAIREDFCGTGFTSATWVARKPEHTAHGLDLDQPTIDWGLKHHMSKLTDEQRSRVQLHNCNVLTPIEESQDVDAVLAMNFSYWIFKTRDELRNYFAIVRESMKKDGVFFLDHYGGWESQRHQTDRKRCTGFTYLWEQHKFNPVTFDAECRIHFEFRDGTKMNSAFAYHWRMWQLPEIQELLKEAGFRKVGVYWEGDDNKGGGNGIFRETKNPAVCPVSLSYIVAER
jgi:cyclopropane fatty-acyl-phospholipid synthase-like methyltransferase